MVTDAPLSLLELLVHCLFALQDTNQDERSFIYGPPKNRSAQLAITCTRGNIVLHTPAILYQTPIAAKPSPDMQPHNRQMRAADWTYRKCRLVLHVAPQRRTTTNLRDKEIPHSIFQRRSLQTREE
ncbi:uncharacterized protein CLUP02_05115 [Colletotrichum lupini]|uniref:Uncharacterized protein n=1 Tax=Colletotrichum lupini TaxID=145971 RepID=A0A9Q8SM13_9PEZI|nr:uncharacterized protein CLUP02_05115 [Colletotrichum lupini]UQC79635.1 hypothetical protein CLUP02_05115 [Colletotrichum lupini]